MESNRRRPFATGSAAKAADAADLHRRRRRHHHHGNHHLLTTRHALSRRYSCPLRPADDRTQTEAGLKTTAAGTHQDESQDVSTLLSVVENLFHNLLVRCGCVSCFFVYVM